MASRAGIDRVRIVRVKLLLDLHRGRGLVVLSIALFSDPKSLLAATVKVLEDEIEDEDEGD